MSLKVYQFYKYVAQSGNYYDYVMKVDDDSYINIDVLASSIPLLPKNWVRYGFFWYDIEKEDSSSKYYDSLYKIGSTYPVYAAGPGHLSSFDIVKFIDSMERPLIVQNDDVNVGKYFGRYHKVVTVLKMFGVMQLIYCVSMTTVSTEVSICVVLRIEKIHLTLLCLLT